MKNLIYKIKKKLNISKKGFTLIEMLVVVLIIGILAGIALPQYTKTVEKTRLAEALLTANALQKAIDIYTLTNGYPDEHVYFLSDDPNGVLDIDIIQNLECTGFECHNKFFTYSAGCGDSSCNISFQRLTNGLGGGNDVEINIIKYKENNEWEKMCYYSSKYEWLCKYLESQGFEREEGC